AETKQGRIRGPVANELIQHHAGVIQKIERGAISEGDADGAIGSGLDRVVPVDRITDLDLGNNAAGAHDGDWAGRPLDLADCLGRRTPHRLGAAAQSAIITAHRRCRGTRYPSLCCGVPRDESLIIVLKSSPAIWLIPPVPDDPSAILPGFALA